MIVFIPEINGVSVYLNCRMLGYRMIEDIK